MSKTTFSDKCAVLGELWLFYKDTDNEVWSEFFEWADLGLPIAYLAWQNLSTPKGEGRVLVEDTWRVFCEMISVDVDGKYESIADAFAASPNGEIE